MKRIFLYFLVCIIIISCKAQVNASLPPNDHTNINTLQQSFIKVFEKNFEFINAEVGEQESELYWIATIKPKDTGIFFIRYRYNIDRTKEPSKYYDSENLIYGDNEFKIKVVNEIKHNYDQNAYYTTIALHEYLLIPIKIGKIYGQHAFLNISGGQDKMFDSKLDQPYLQPNIKQKGKSAFKWNSIALAPKLSYYKNNLVDISEIGDIVPRYNIHQDLFIKADEIGKLTLEINSHTFLLHQEDSWSYIKRLYSVIIIDKNGPVYKLPKIETQYWYDKKYTSGAGSYNYYTNNVLLLKVGEVLEIPILDSGSILEGLKEEIMDIFKNDHFTIKKLKFSTYLKKGYESWIANKYK